MIKMSFFNRLDRMIFKRGFRKTVFGEVNSLIIWNDNY